MRKLVAIISLLTIAIVAMGQTRYQKYIYAANAGDAEAQYEIANCYVDGIGVERDEKAGYEWICKASNQGNIKGIIQKGWFLYAGIGVKKDKNRGLEIIQKYAADDNPIALNFLGLVYALKHTKESNKIAFDFFKRSAELGFSFGQLNLAHSYKWEGIERDDKAIFNWLLKSAMQGNESAQIEVGEIYEQENSTVIEKDYLKALEWYRKAEEQGYEPAKKKIASLEKRIEKEGGMAHLKALQKQNHSKEESTVSTVSASINQESSASSKNQSVTSTQEVSSINPTGTNTNIQGVNSVVKSPKLEIKSFNIDEKDMTANTAGTTVMDQNGQKCALIKVQTTQKGFSFEVGSLGVVKTMQKVGEVWVYVPEGVKRISIFHQQFGSIKNYELGQSLQRARTYVLNLETEHIPLVKSQKVIIDFSPENAMVLIDSKPFKGNGHIETTLPVGNHNYIIAAEGYETIEGSFKLTETVPRSITEKLIASAVLNNPETSNISMSQNESEGFSSINSDTFHSDVLGATFRLMTESQKKQLKLDYGLMVEKVENSKLKEAGIPKGFFITLINDIKIYTAADFNKAISKSNDMIIIRGCFPTGKRGGFVIYL